MLWQFETNCVGDNLTIAKPDFASALVANAGTIDAARSTTPANRLKQDNEMVRMMALLVNAVPGQR